MTDVRHTAAGRARSSPPSTSSGSGSRSSPATIGPGSASSTSSPSTATSLVFVEVKTRRSGSREPWESLHDRKRSKVRRMAVAWLTEGPTAPTARNCASTARRPARRAGELVRLDHLEAAF